MNINFEIIFPNRQLLKKNVVTNILLARLVDMNPEEEI
jgi:hypothetical protein